MNLKRAFLLSVSVAITLLLTFSTIGQTVHHSGLPKIDEILYKVYFDEYRIFDIVDDFLAGNLDWINGPTTKDLYDAVVAAGHKLSPQDPSDEFSFIAINCRDHKEMCGEPNFPLNDSNFRKALSYIYSVEDKDNDIYNSMNEPWRWAIGNPVPPAQKPWYNQSIQMPQTGDNSTAWTILQAHGYYVNSTDNWVHCNGTKLRNMNVTYTTGKTYWSLGPGLGFVSKFNAFVQGYLGADGPLMTLKSTEDSLLIVELLLLHDYDFICMSLANIGIFADWLYDCLHSDNIGPWLWNFCGIVDPIFDTYTEIILTSLNVTEVIEACSIVQAHFVYNVMPWIPIGTKAEFCTVAREAPPPNGRGELMNLISMPNYGPSNDWTWMAMHWNYSWPGGTVRTAWLGEPGTLSPYTEDTQYGWQMLDRVISSLTMREPINLIEIPWIATDWSLNNWVSIPELNILDGSSATFYLRQDVKWHDGEPVTAYDCVNNLRILKKYYQAYCGYCTLDIPVYEETDGPYKFTTYFDRSSMHYLNHVAETALLIPKHITDIVERWVEQGKLTYFLDWNPAYHNYSELGLGDPPAKYSFMKQLVGCGPFVFDYYDTGLATGRIVKYDEFFANAPVIGSVAGDWRTDPDSSYTYKVLIQNVAAKEDSPQGELTEVTVDVKVYEDDVLTYDLTDITLNLWDFTYLGPYSTPTLTPGEHTVRVEFYESESLIHKYNHTFVVTVREDLTTYSGKEIDFCVDGSDIIVAAKAFGSYPNHARWDSLGDVNDDFIVDGSDLIHIARKFGWGQTP